MVNWLWFRSTCAITANYIGAGADFGDMVSYLYMGEPVGFERALSRWATYEVEYARRGFRTVSLSDFVAYGGYGKSLDDKVGILRAPSEEPVLYALRFEQKYRGKLLNEAIDLRAVVLEPDETNFIESVGTYELPDLSDDANAET